MFEIFLHPSFSLGQTLQMQSIQEGAPKSHPPLLRVALVLGCPILAFALGFGFFADPLQAKVVTLALWMLMWWVLEVVPLFVTSLLPVILLPTLGAMPLPKVAESYVTEVFFLFLGGFLLAAAAEKWSLHEFFAHRALRNAGTSARRVVLLFMLISAFISMWISNSATALLMMPLVRLYAKGESRAFHKAILLCVGYACSIGGMATLIGSPPNAMYAAHMQMSGKPVSFLSWLVVSFPFALLGIFLTWLVVNRFAFPSVWTEKTQKKEISGEKWKKRPLAIVGGAFLLLSLGLLALPLVGNPLSDATWILLLALILFVIPSGEGSILESEDLAKIPWEMLLLFGGGIALSSALSHSGLTKLMVNQLGTLQSVPAPIAVFTLVCFFILFTEFSSNTAVAAVGIPLAVPLASVFGLESEQMAQAVVYAASLSFMLPVATPPNAIVYSEKVFTSAEMARVGIWLNISFALLISLWVLLFPIR